MAFFTRMVADCLVSFQCTRREEEKVRWRMRTSNRRTRLELQCNLPYVCSRVVLMDQNNCFFPVNEEQGEEEEEEGRGGGGGGGGR